MSRRLRSAGVTVGLVLAAGIGFACAEGEPDQEFMDADYGQVCMEEATEVRVFDDRCEDSSGGGGFHWVYVGRPHVAPAVGSKFTKGTYSMTPPAGVGSRVPSSGGFGGKISTGGG